jgi:serine/threonine protein kinase
LGSIAIAHKKEVAASDDSAKTALSETDDHHETRHSNHDADDAVTTTATESSLHEHHEAAAIAPDDGAPVLIQGRFVLKIISKAIASRQKQEVHVMAEAQALKSLKHPFLCRLYGKFQTPKDLVLVLERVSGGDLWCVMYEATDVPRVSRMGGSYLSLDLVRFYIASLILALEFMHQRGTAFRNLKPENVLIDDRGYVRLVGFGFAKKYPFTDDSGVQQHRSFTFCGTLGRPSLDAVFFA